MKEATKAELKAGLEKMFGEGECLENVFAMSYMVAGYPIGVDEEMFCDWVRATDPSIEKMVDYFNPKD